MVELSVEAILQIDATIITGILILLTLGRSSTAYEISKHTTSVVLPFLASAIIELLSTVWVGDPPVIIRYFSIACMIAGFIYIGVVVLRLPKIRSI